jgi:hypothetical protein
MAKHQQGTTVSVVLIVKDEERVLASCLESVTWADQVVVYDTGSTDRTVEIARQFADVVVEGYWDDDFGAARNRAAEHATGEWIFSIDADEVFDGDPRQLRRRLAAAPAAIDVFAVLVQDAAPSVFDSIDSSVGGRLFRRATGCWKGELHEQIVARPEVGRDLHVNAMPSVVLHHSGYSRATMELKGKDDRNLTISRHDLEVALATGMSDRDVAMRRANLARSLVLHGDLHGALDEGVASLEGDHLNPRLIVQLAAAMVLAATLLRDRPLEDKWLELWEAAEGNQSWVHAARARAAAQHDDFATALAALDRLPKITVAVDGQRLERRSLARLETWALTRAGRTDEALAVALDATEHRVAPGEPAEVMSWLGRDGARQVIERVGADQWTAWALRCTANATRPALELLGVMDEVRPHSGAVLASAATLSFLMTLEEATQWAVALRAAGLEDRCTLVALAEEEQRPPRARALAAALAFDVYQDARALEALQRALPLVAPEEEAALAAELEIVAPGLITAG